MKGFLVRRLLDESGGDLALTRFVTGASLAHSQSAVHYSALSKEEVVNTYLRALGAKKTEVPKVPPDTSGKPEAQGGSPGDPEETTAAGAPAPTAMAIGARRVPTVGAVRTLVKKLADHVRNSTGVEYRNALTAYTLLGFNITVAGREIEERRLQNKVPSHRLIVISDKGKPYNSRAVVVPPRLEAQLANYRRAARSWGYEIGDGPHGLFCRWGAGEAPEGPFTPAHFEELAEQKGFDLELYALRRFARSELLARGASPEDIDALMGHWLHLMSPHDMLSTYPTRRLTTLADRQIESLLKDIHYEPLQ